MCIRDRGTVLLVLEGHGDGPLLVVLGHFRTLDVALINQDLAAVSYTHLLPMPLESIWLPIQVQSCEPAVNARMMTTALKIPGRPSV